MPKVLCCERIKEGMSIRGMRQADLVEKTGISKSKISHYCNGKYVPKQDATFLIAKALEVDEAWLMGYDVPMEKQKANGLAEKITRLDSTDLAVIEKYVDFLLTSDKYEKKKEATTA